MSRVTCPECPVCPDGQTRNECITCLQCPEQNQNLIPSDEGSGSDLCCVSKRKTSSNWTDKIRDEKDAFGREAVDTLMKEMEDRRESLLDPLSVVF